MRTHPLTVVVCLLASACAKPKPSSVETPTSEPAEPASAAVDASPPAIAPVESGTVEVVAGVAGELLQEPFGGDQWGFAQASGGTGRFVFMRLFGASRPDFGHHGEPMGGWPKFMVFDRVAGTEREIDELVTIDLSRRYLVVIDDGQTWLLDDRSGSWSSLANVDMEADRNACLWPRQAGFSEQGKRLGWVREGAATMRVRDLESGDEWEVASPNRIWRGWPKDADMGGVLIEVPAGSSDWPVQGTSCACLWCGRFALSYSTYGWSGPSFEIIEVTSDGARGPGEPPTSDVELHADTIDGCKLRATKDEGESLEHGPWWWEC